MLPPLLTLIITHFMVFLPHIKKNSITGSQNNKEYIKTSHILSRTAYKSGHPEYLQGIMNFLQIFKNYNH